MNREECLKSKCMHNEYWKLVRHKLKMWQKDNGLTCKCVVHHRDDTEETLKYNSEHYELWGFNEDGTFEYGKYVVFMPLTEHVSYHHTGEKNSNYGKHLSEETCSKLSTALKGLKHSEEFCTKISAARRGKKLSEETCTKLSVAKQGEKNPMYGKNHSDETREKMSATHKIAQYGRKLLYITYKDNGGTLNWNDFQRALKNGEITFEMQPITVYVNGGTA